MFGGAFHFCSLPPSHGAVVSLLTTVLPGVNVVRQ
jgi:hypothetical protein